MIYPVTPNGVEHFSANATCHGSAVVIYPVTPNGVEHSDLELVGSTSGSDLSGNA